MPNRFDGFFSNNGLEATKAISKINKQFSELSKSPVISALPAIKNIVDQKIIEIYQPVFKLLKSFELDIPKIKNIVFETANFFDNIMKSEFEYKKEIKLKWKNFVEDIKNKNENINNSPLISLFDICLIEARYTLDKVSPLYRARKFDINKFTSQVFPIIERISEEYEEYGYLRQYNNENDYWDYLFNISIDELERLFNYDIDLKNIIFWGYDINESDAPPLELAKEGRANAKGVICLYAAKEEITAISEIQPTNGQIVSVAEIELKNDLNLFNFNFYEAFNENQELLEKSLPEIKEKLGISFDKLRIIFETISDFFSKPYLENPDIYLSTQYLSEYIKSKGFDGLVFKSSLHENGINIVLFDTSKDDTGNPFNYTIKNSKLIKVDKVEVHYKQLLPKENKIDNVQ